VRGGVISGLLPPEASPAPDPSRLLRLDGCLVLPGLVNAHDHLEFSLFPRLGHGPYPNTRQWAADIYHPSQSPIREHLEVSKDKRLIWGGLKNLLSGVTTVCHHNPYEPRVFEDRFPVRVVSRFGWAHSLDFTDDVAARFAATPPGAPFLLHLGEATDEAGRREIFQLDSLGALDGRTVLVHAVGLDAAGLALAESRGAGLIWCPSSNLFTLGTTLEGAVFRSNMRLALATDSALTGEGGLLDELIVGQRLGRVGRQRLYEMVTTESAAVLRLEAGEGRLAEGGVADLIAIPDAGCAPYEALTADEVCPGPLLVMVGGDLKLLVEDFADRLDMAHIRNFQRIRIEGRRSSLMDADVGALLASARASLGTEKPIRLAGRAIQT
jgi:cytosine/adenosine deaminase-related metal-dependent hydrolase